MRPAPKPQVGGLVSPAVSERADVIELQEVARATPLAGHPIHEGTLLPVPRRDEAGALAGFGRPKRGRRFRGFARFKLRSLRGFRQFGPVSLESFLHKNQDKIAKLLARHPVRQERFQLVDAFKLFIRDGKSHDVKVLGDGSHLLSHQLLRRGTLRGEQRLDFADRFAFDLGQDLSFIFDTVNVLATQERMHLRQI